MWHGPSTIVEDNGTAQGANSGLRKALGICLTGGLRGICERAHGPQQLYNRLLRPFERLGGFDVFATVSFEDCDRARALLGSPPINAHILCYDSLEVPRREYEWTQHSPLADPDVCPGTYCGYVWRDVANCGRLLRRRISQGASYWRVARARADLVWELFPRDPEVAFADDHVIWGYALPDAQWIAMPDRFAIGPQHLMLDFYFRTYQWMLNPQNWPIYDAHNSPPCVRRGHMELRINEAGDSYEAAHVRGKTWACPEHSARRMAYPGPENVLEAWLRSRNVAFRLRRDVCFNHIRRQCGLKQDSVCERRPKRNWHGVVLNDWEVAPFDQGEPFNDFVERQVGKDGYMKLESGLLHHDGLWTAQLAELMFEEWGRQGRPPRIVDLGCGRGALVEQLDRFNLPVVGVDGSEMAQIALRIRGLRADLASGEVFGNLQACEDKPNKVWCRWLRGLGGSDWALSLDVLQDIPRSRIYALAKHLRRHGKQGAIISWLGATHSASKRELLRHMRSAGYTRDSQMTARLRQFGGLLNSPSHRRALVLRKHHREDVVCDLRLLEPEEDSGWCVFRQSFGCVDDGIWVHFGCAARFHWWQSRGAGIVLSCRSEQNEYAECGRPAESVRESSIDHPLEGVLHTPSTEGFEWAEECAACHVLRSDLMKIDRKAFLAQHSREHLHSFSQVFGLPVGHLFDALDPLTSETDAVWLGDIAARLLTMALLRTFKLCMLAGQHLVADASWWSRNEWPQLRNTFVLASSAIWPSIEGDLERFATLISCLRVAIVHLRKLGWSSIADAQRSRSQDGTCEPWPRQLNLDSPCAEAMVSQLDREGLHRFPPDKRSVSFSQHGDSWHAQYIAGAPLARYLYRVSYHATAVGWIP